MLGMVQVEAEENLTANLADQMAVLRVSPASDDDNGDNQKNMVGFIEQNTTRSSAHEYCSAAQGSTEPANRREQLPVASLSKLVMLQNKPHRCLSLAGPAAYGRMHLSQCTA